MIEEWLNVVLFLSGAIAPSAISGIYLLFSLFILSMLLTIHQVPKAIYKVLFFISLLLVTWKAIMLILLQEGLISNVFAQQRHLFSLLGVFYSEDLNWDNSSALTFIPDCLAFTCSLIGWIYAKKVKFSPSDKKRKDLWLFCCFAMLTATVASNFSYINIGYFVIWIYWAFTWSCKLSKTLFKYGVLVISLFTTLQILFSYFFHVVLYQEISQTQAETYGIVISRPEYLPNYVFVFVLHCFSTMYVRKAGIKQQIHDLQVKLLKKGKTEEEIEEILKIHREKTIEEEQKKELDSGESLYTDSSIDGSSEEESVSQSESSSNSEKKSKKSSSGHSETLEKRSESPKEKKSIKSDSPPVNSEQLPIPVFEMNYPAIPVVPSSDSLKSSPRFDIFSMSKRLLSPVFLFFLARLLLFIWIFYFESALGVYIMIWLFYSILELNHERMIFISRYTLIPVLTLISFLTYTLNTFAVSTSEFFGIYYKSSPCAEYLFQALTILTLLFINRVLGYKNKSTEITTETKDVFGIIYTVVQQNSDKLSLIILFLVGLSNISLFHIGFILICLIFLIDIKLARKYWKVLMFYTMAILLIRYIWQLLIPVISHTDSELLNFIGLPTTSIMNAKTLLILPYDYSIWILLFSAGIQNRAFGSTMFSIDYYKLTKADFRNKHNLIVNYIVNIYEWYTIFQVWVSYFFIFLIMLVSPLNILNYVRFACFCTFMLIHLKEITTEISFNYLAVKKLWGVTVYYSGVLLIVRYLYQFIPYLHFAFDTQFVLIGIEVYKDSDLYGYMVADCTLLLFSILESRNRQDDIDRDSFEFEEVGFLTGIIRANQSLLGQEKHVITALQYLEEPFPLLVLLVVSSLAVYWKLSLSMLCYLAAMGWYLLRLGNYFGQVVEHKELYSAEFEWELRVRSWRVLFFITFVNFILSYAEFLVTPVIFGDVVYQKVLWLYFCCGFSKTQGDTLISVNYGYAILWVLLIIERHCIEFMLKTRVNISQEEEFKRLLNKNVVLMKTLDFLRVFAEGLVPMLVLLIAFNKLTFISIVYVFAVFLGIIFASPYKRTHILNMVVIVSIWLQYFLILSNIQATNSPDALPKDRKISNSPWYTRVNWTTSDDPVFLNLGTDIEQLHNTYPDLLCSLCIMIYYKFLCTKEHELFLIEHGTIEEPATSQGKNIFAWVKKAIYNLSHMIIFLFVLLFIIQNNGLISGVYCLFCLRFIYGANEVIRSEEGWNKYLKILRMYFLTFMLLDLTCNILIQIPFGLIDISNNSWLVAIGVQRLWRAGQDSAPPNESSLHAKVDFKIVAFAFLYMMYRMMRSKDFNDHMALERADFNAQGHTTGYLLAKEFNDSRIAENARFQEKRARFETELKKLDVNVQKWNQKFYEEKRDSLGVTRNRGATVRRKTTILKEQPKINNESTFKSRFQNLLISLINPVIFQNYLEKIRAHGNIRISFDEEEVKIDEDEGKICEVEGEKLEEEGEMNEKGKDKAESFMEINFFNKKVLDEYNLTWKNYFMMCGLILMSNTQILFFLSCIMNHLIYASLESIIFPLSVLGYAMLEYPRPPFLYFRIMMIYAELIFFIKFTIQFEIWELLFGQTYMRNYQDAYKIGFNLAGNTYSSTLLYYVVWDVVVMLFILLHEYSLLRVGLWKYTEYEMETFDDAKLRIERKVSKVLRKKKKNWKASGLLLRATTEIKNFLNRLLPKNKEEKPGKDLYTPTICVQFLILLYLFIFFSKMDGKGMDISKSFRANQFQGRMVVAVMIQISIMIIERYLYLERTSQALKLAVSRLSHPSGDEPNIKWDRPLQFKLILHVCLLLTVSYTIFWYFPINSTEISTGTQYCLDRYDSTKCNNFEINPSLICFFLIYTTYFVIVALQLKFGLPSFRSGSFPLMKSTSRLSKIAFQFYRGIPFLFEIRTLVDWVCTLTALDLYQWFKFENLYAQLYINQCNSKVYQARVRGSKIGSYSKLGMGCCTLLFILGMILAPLILFSSLNPIVESNRVKSMAVQIGVTVDENFFNLYSASRVSDIHDITNSEWDRLNFNSLNGVESTDKDITQVITMPTTSDSLWDMTPPSYLALCTSLNALLKSPDPKIILQMSHTYSRKYPDSFPKISQDFSYPLTYQQVYNLNLTICSSATVDFFFPNMPLILIWLSSSGQSLTPDIITDSNKKKTIILKKIPDPNGYFFWEVGIMSEEHKLQGLVFFTISEKYSPMTFSFSVVTFYISVVWLCGRLIRWFLAGPVNFIMTEMPNPEPIINLCNGVYLSRMTGDLKREEELFYELVDILRSPEMLKLITGRSSIKQKVD